MANARFLLRPRWLVSHLLVALLVVVMVNLGFWQLRRLDEKRDHIALVESRRDQPVAPVGEVLTPGGSDADVDAARYRRVTATGTYDAAATVTVRNRSQGGVAGAWLVSPLVLDSGDRVAVVRGFVSLTPGNDVVDAPAPDGDVTVEGLVVDPDRLDGTAPKDLAPLLRSRDVLPGLVLASASAPPEPSGATAEGAGPDSILAVPPPEMTEGPHLGYAAQWFIFSTIAVVGYPIVLRRVVARRGKEVDDDRDGPGGPDLDRDLDELSRQGG
ncbi:MAG TPA: SURF1 family protein [Acidimicrobiales bacterium]|nr:SURF1 family protein [Acidimicrobiales bacterium]